jgi:hypothetical protein
MNLKCYKSVILAPALILIHAEQLKKNAASGANCRLLQHQGLNQVVNRTGPLWCVPMIV